MQLDDTDLSLLRILAEHARISWVELAAALAISRQTAAERVLRLEAEGVIRGYSARIDPERVGAGLTAFVAATVERPEHCPPFLERVATMDEVLECHHIAGDDSYLLKVRTGSTRDLERLITEGLKQIAGVTRTRTTIVLSTSKETALPALRGGIRP